MITEIALLNIQPGESAAFEAAVGEAQKIISSMHGYIEHELQTCLEEENKYLLIVRWQRLKTIRKDLERVKHTRNGKNYCIIFITHSR